MKIYNSLTKTKEEFEPINPPKVGLYTCGMTVYDYAHIGHGRKYVYDDVLRRSLEYFGYEVNHVQNVTDVGHLVSDGDEGEDKLEKGAKKFGKTVWEVAEYFTDHFYNSMDALNILRPSVIAKATDHISQQIEMVKKLIDNGYGYETEEAVYFDVSKFEKYGEMFGQKIEDKQVGVRDEVKTDDQKRNPADFALWFKCVGRFGDHVMQWESPWGMGFPGWHIECSAMSMEYLGDQFDIHTGGEDHLPIHHPNEIAQAEGASGKSPFVKYWVHHAFLMVDGTKMSKSLGNVFSIEDVINKGYDPVALRYLYLTSHYKKQQNFTWEALESAQTALRKLRSSVSNLRQITKAGEIMSEQARELDRNFKDVISDDLNLPNALAVVWEVVKDQQLEAGEKLGLLLQFDRVLGLGLESVAEESVEVPAEIEKMAKERDKLRAENKFAEADGLRDELLERGYEVEDTQQGTVVKKVSG